MGKKSYDSHSDMSYGGKKSSKMPMATDTSKMGYVPNKSYGSAGANVTGSRLNKGGDKAWKGKRGRKKASMSY